MEDTAYRYLRKCIAGYVDGQVEWMHDFVPFTPIVQDDISNHGDDTDNTENPVHLSLRGNGGLIVLTPQMLLSFKSE